MPLINLTTDLKNLRYGGDRPGGGSSGQPYIVSPNPDIITTGYVPAPLDRAQQPYTFLDFYNLNKDTDYPIRGGSIRLGEFGLDTTPAGSIDRRRIGAFLRDNQRGTMFKLKQIGLQLTNPRTQVQNVLQGDQLLEITRVYNDTGLTTLEQVGTQGTGTHIIRHGLTPATQTFPLTTYENIATFNNTGDLNRLATLLKSKLRLDAPVYLPGTANALRYGISPLNNQILSYEGGPGSTYGVGRTIINRATNTNTARAYRTVAFTYDTIQQQNTTDGVSVSHPKLQDFRGIINTQAGQLTQMEGYYDDSNAWFNKTGNPGAVTPNFRVNYTQDTGQSDPTNFVSPFIFDPSAGSPWTEGEDTSDIIKFGFECISNDYQDQAVALVFRAFLTSFSDQHQASLNSFKYFGRGETFRTYQGYDRSISFGFKIAVLSRPELRPLYTKLNHLVSQIYPDYSSTSKFMRGSIVKLTIGDYLYRVPGFLENVNITVDNNASWEIALENNGDGTGDVRQLPQTIDVQCSFKPIHDFLPQRVTQDTPYVPLIANTPEPFLLNTVRYSKSVADAMLQQQLQQLATQNIQIGAGSTYVNPRLQMVATPPAPVNPAATPQQVVTNPDPATVGGRLPYQVGP